MDTSLIKALVDAGLGAIGLGLFAWLFMLQLKSHRKERDEFRKDIKEDRQETRAVLSELTSVIRTVNRVRNDTDNNSS